MLQSFFTNNQLKRFANILDNSGQVVLGLLVITPLTSKSYENLQAFGVIAVTSVWWISLRIERILSR